MGLVLNRYEKKIGEVLFFKIVYVVSKKEKKKVLFYANTTYRKL